MHFPKKHKNHKLKGLILIEVGVSYTARRSETISQTFENTSATTANNATKYRVDS
jgi:hypothetical protein